MQNQYKEIMTMDEVCDYLRICRNTVKSLIKQKKLKAYKFGKEYRFRMKDIDELFEEGIEND